MDTQQTGYQEFEYKAEMKQLLHIIIHSLYSHPEVFLRELVSNASDALNKVRFRRLTDPNILEPEKELKISITVDKENELFLIEDTGIGMTKDDLINQIGTVASSGTLEFLKKIKEEKSSLDANMIGQFGVGFYSVFMVTDEITIETRSADTDSQAWRWKSAGEDKFTLEEIDRTERGTKISFKLKEDYKEFYEPFKINSILKKYSNFVDFPIFVNNEVENKVTAIWQRKKEDVKPEEFTEFYKYLTNDNEDPMGHLQISIEGVLNFKALLFIPQTAPSMMFRDTSEKTLHLYSSKIFIQDDCKELLPDYLRFVKGVVDTEDLPLNVSREVTQSSPVMTKIKNVLTSKIIALLEEWATEDTGKYEKFYKSFGQMFKVGVNSDYTNKDKIIDLLRFETSATENGVLSSFKEYSGRMKEDQKEIYYMLADSREKAEQTPNLEYFKKKGIEVIYLTDPVDIFTIPYIFEYDKKPIMSIDKVDINLTKEEEVRLDSLSPEMAKSLIEVFKETLGDLVEDVVESKRLVDSPVTLVVGKQGLDPHTEKMMQILDKDFSVSKRILEINPSHPLIKNLSRLNIADSKDSKLRLSIMQLYEGACLIEGHLKSPADFVKRMTEIMEEATKVG